MEVLRQVASSLARNKLRSFLTMAGIAWGVASIVLIVAMGDGFKEGQRKNTASLGENIVIVFGGRTELQAGGQRAGRRIRLTYDDLREFAPSVQVSKATGELQNQVNATSSYNSGSFSTVGVEPIYSQLRTIPIEGGRFFDDADDRDSRRVCILGEQRAQAALRARGAECWDRRCYLNGHSIHGNRPEPGQATEQQLQRPRYRQGLYSLHDDASRYAAQGLVLPAWNPQRYRFTRRLRSSIGKPRSSRCGA